MSIADDDYQTILKALVENASVDYVGLWELPSWVEQFMPGVAPDDVRAVTLKLVGDLMEKGSLRAGQLSGEDPAFVPCRLSSQELVSRIATAWPLNERRPTNDETVWFDIPRPGGPDVRPDANA